MHTKIDIPISLLDTDRHIWVMRYGVATATDRLRPAATMKAADTLAVGHQAQRLFTSSSSNIVNSSDHVFHM